MKLLIILLTLCLCSYTGSSQSLEGEWNGSFTYSYTDLKIPDYTFQKDKTPIKITFMLNADSSYSIFSYSNGPNSRSRDTTYVCAVFYRKISSDSLYLEEMRMIKPENVPSDCMQKMYLKLEKRKRGLTLEGSWKANPDKCSKSGEIRLYRKNL